MAEANTEPTRRLFPIRWDRQTALDVLFVLVLPVLAVLFDPGVITRGPFAPESIRQTLGGPGYLYYLQLPLHFSIILLIVLFWLSKLPNLSQWQNSLFRGSLIFGGILASLFAVYMMPLTFFALFMAPYLVPFGLVPAITAWRFFRRARALPTWKYGMSHVVAGLITPALLSISLHFTAEKTLEPMFQQLRSTEPDVGLAALEELTGNLLCRSGCRDQILFMHCHGYAPFPADKSPPLRSGEYGDIIRTDVDCAFTW